VIDLLPIFLSLRLAVMTVAVLLVVSLPAAYILSFTRLRTNSFLEALMNLPLILPPSVLGFYLLYLFSPQQALGKFIESTFNVRLVFTFPSLVIASVIFSFPIMVNAFKTGFRSVPKNLLDCANVLGLSRWTLIFKVIFPYCRRHILSGMVLTFAHTIGAFGILLMIGGNIEGKTRLASIAIFNEVESMNYSAAHMYSLILTGITLAILFVLIKMNKKLQVERHHVEY
jgi:molybdate transport system permease protein